MTAVDATGARALGSPVRGGLRLAVYLLWTLLLVPVQALAVAVRSPLRFRIPRFYHRVCAAILGIGVVVRGERATDGPVLFVSNHSSYLDITVLGSVIPGSFVAKSEVAGWPFFGALAKLQQTVFVERKARSGVEKQRDELGARLDAGDSLILFPEGTSSDGNRTLPFKTALFAVAARRIGERPLTVQPVSIAPTRLDGIPMGIAFRPCYAWYGDMDLAPHLWTVFTLGRMTVEVEFHPPVTIDGFSSRKALADHCQRAVARGVERAVSGKPPPTVVP
ncbi:1-acyl-sn-glycerol-3-phosphate acyltransferase [Azospirillum brasilense]|uniref:Lysophospholipid acyltransferase family protein n=1 Tax=Azospirillum brasilense TaxID=192 RepID=A0ABU4P4G6_AZOBR|nr:MULTISPECIES: lysophospholipid acyltransferase family protein [Azospirillum]ALJ34052.1 acyl-phosphate glycerol 3-phosphate acyltransferase [Azospirillum brasilense]MDW7552981.1 lysophospholipid acyltransferase family protein [Azospirillum brasilense]MDW7591827.1 lysophospholipid acyltransferase family protein [Azospirillum brasilense]MDW7627896.1 lysophospholipid acyltransferase family protein [Azospirillum brasilense]MDX5952635.1 lysophospholipid acyltransferase family protein [Azospirillu